MTYSSPKINTFLIGNSDTKADRALISAFIFIFNVAPTHYWIIRITSLFTIAFLWIPGKKFLENKTRNYILLVDKQELKLLILWVMSFLLTAIAISLANEGNYSEAEISAWGSIFWGFFLSGFWVVAWLWARKAIEAIQNERSERENQIVASTLRTYKPKNEKLTSQIAKNQNVNQTTMDRKKIKLEKQKTNIQTNIQLLEETSLDDLRRKYLYSRALLLIDPSEKREKREYVELSNYALAIKNKAPGYSTELLFLSSALAYSNNDIEFAMQMCEKTLQMLQETKNEKTFLEAGVLKLEVLLFDKRWKEAEELVLKLQQIAQKLGNKATQAQLFISLSKIQKEGSKIKEQIQFLEKALELSRETDQFIVEAVSLHELGLAKKDTQILQKAVLLFLEGSEIKLTERALNDLKKFTEQRNEPIEKIKLLKILLKSWIKDDHLSQQAIIKEIEKSKTEDAFSLTFIGILLSHNQNDLKVNEYLKKALVLDTKQTKTKLLLGINQTHLGELEKALTSFEEVITSDDYQGTDAYLCQASVYTQLGQEEKANKITEKALKINPWNINSFESKALFHMSKEEFKEAELNYTKIIEITGFNSYFKHQKIKTIALSGEISRAIKECNKVLETDSFYPDIITEKANLLVVNDEPIKAISEADQVLNLQPNNIPALTCKIKGLVALDEQEKALKLTDKALIIEPANAFLWGIKGTIFRELGVFHEAGSAFEKVIQLKSADFRGWFMLGSTQKELKQYEEAIESLREALTLEPDLLQAQELIAESYLALNQPEEARIEAKVIIEKDETRGHAWAILAIEASLRGEIDEALNYANLGLEKGKDKPKSVIKLLEDLIESLLGLKK
ncbi:MAG: tetratricopeptide repeat protein [Candidatus Kariarchaeaceae archaeon]